MPAARALVPAAIALLALSAAPFAAGCARSPAAPPVGVSNAAPDQERAPAPAPPRQRWADYAAAQAWPAAAPPSAALGHRRDGSLLEVRVEPPALEAYRQLTVESPMPDGARVLAWLRGPRGGLLGGYLLEKRGGVWGAKQLDAEGGVVPGDSAACLRCHELAPTDHLFGTPQRSPGAPPGGEESLAPAAR